MKKYFPLPQTLQIHILVNLFCFSCFEAIELFLTNSHFARHTLFDNFAKCHIILDMLFVPLLGRTIKCIIMTFS